MKFLRHEAGHALNYAYRLWLREEWVETFGVFTRPYRDEFQPQPFSRSFVRHLDSSVYGRTYAQKHPDDDFAETFAVWLTPRSAWRRRYRGWPAMRKLRYIDGLMKDIARTSPPKLRTRQYRPVEALRLPLAEHYGKKAKRLRRAAQGYVDDKLREIFPVSRSKALLPAAELLRGCHDELLQRAVRWSGLEEKEAAAIVGKLEERASGAAALLWPLAAIRQAPGRRGPGGGALDPVRDQRAVLRLGEGRRAAVPAGGEGDRQVEVEGRVPRRRP